jgi:type I restriction enzyme, S subunit
MKRTALGEACARVDYGLTTSAVEGGTGPRFLRITDIENSFVDWQTVPRCVADSVDVDKYRLESGDIVVARTGASTGRSLWVRTSEPAVFASYLVRFRALPSFDSRYLSYVLTSTPWSEHVNATAHGKSAQPNMSASSMAAFVFSHPQLSEQRAIAEVLGALDDKIAANARLCNVADEYLANQFSLAFATAEIRSVPLGEIAAVNAAVVRPSSGQLRYIDISAVHVGSYEYPELIDWNQAPSRARRKVSFGDTLWSTVRPNRRSHALNLHDDTNLVASTGLAVLSPIKTGFAYLYEVTKRPEFSAYLETVAEGSAYPAVREDRFKDAPVPLVAAQEVRKFETVAGPLRRLAHATSVESRTLAALRDALLPHLMSGKLRVRDAEKQIEAVV